MKPFLALVLLLTATAAHASKNDPRQCSSYFLMVEQDESTSNLAMAGLNKGQLDWINKDGGKKEYAGVCPILPTVTGKRVPTASLKDGLPDEAKLAGKPIYVIEWKQVRLFVPDTTYGHYAYPSSGVLYRMGDDPEGKLSPVGPVHDTSRTILSDATISLLKAAIKQIKEQ
jgi:hypothetical protein